MKPTAVERIWGPAGLRLLAGDILVIVVLSAAALALLISQGAAGAPSCAEVEAAGRRALVLDLGRDGITDVGGPLGTTRLEVRDKRVRVVASPCPRQVCRHGGWIGRPGEIIACVPNGVVVRISGRRPEAIDAVAR